MQSTTTEVEPEVDLIREDLATPCETEQEVIPCPPLEGQTVPPTTEPVHQLFEDSTREESPVVNTFIDVGHICLCRSARL